MAVFIEVFGARLNLKLGLRLVDNSFVYTATSMLPKFQCVSWLLRINASWNIKNILHSVPGQKIVCHLNVPRKNVENIILLCLNFDIYIYAQFW